MAPDEDEKQIATSDVTNKKGGIRTMPFIIANEAFERAAGVGLQANMAIYLKKEYHFTNVKGAYILFIWGAVSDFMPTLGAFVSDSWLGRFRVVSLGTIITFLGMIGLWLTALIPSARPPKCDLSNALLCASPKPAQLGLLFASFALMSIGAGGIRSSSLAFGADQFNDPDNPKNERILQSFFNWYYALVCTSMMVSVLIIVAIQDSIGWAVGFGIPVGLMFLSASLFLLGSSLYVKVKANKSLLTGFAQVISAAWKNRHLALPPRESDRWYHHKGSKLVVPTERLGFVNRACIITGPEDLDSKGLAVYPWKLCTVNQVEELKALIKVLPIWSTGIMVAVTISQHSFPVLLASTMNRHFIGKAQIPAASYGVFAILTLILWVAFYDRVLVPLLATFAKRPQGFTNKERMGIGILISCIATTVAGLVEHRRRAQAFKQGLEDDSRAVVNMSGMWLLPQHCLVGLAEGFNAIGQIEFYYSQFPKTMSSIGLALFSLGMGVGNLMGSLILRIVDDVSKRYGNMSWVSDNLNRGHYDYYYWVLASLRVVNFFYYLLCSWAYGREDKNIWDKGEDMEEDGIHQSVGSPFKPAAF